MKKDKIISLLANFLLSCSFLLITLFIFDFFDWGVKYYNKFSIINVSLIYSFLCIGGHEITNIYLAFKLKDILSSSNPENLKKLPKIVLTKIALEFVISGVFAYISLTMYSKEIIISGFWTYISVILMSLVFKEVFNFVLAYRQNKEKFGGR